MATVAEVEKLALDLPETERAVLVTHLLENRFHRSCTTKVKVNASQKLCILVSTACATAPDRSKIRRAYRRTTTISRQPSRPEIRRRKVPNFNVPPQLAEAKSSQLYRLL